MASKKAFKIALIQVLVSTDKVENLQKALGKVTEAANAGAKIVVLPESFNAPYGHEFFKAFSEPIPGPCTDALGEAAKKHKVYLIGGSMIEAQGDIFYNSCPIFNPEGTMVAVHRKLHMFDIDVPGGIRFIESETLSPGIKPTIIETEFCKIGLGICYDIRFGELARLYAKEDCDLLVYPGCFNMTTGPAHWELLTRTRAVDCQSFVAVCSQARDTGPGYTAWGHSTVVDPWGTILATCEEQEATIFADIDLDRAHQVRQQIPIRKQRRTDIYDTVAKMDFCVSK